jgi:hypothetical protein
MRSPEGEDHWVWGEYQEIVEPSGSFSLGIEAKI